MKTRWLDIILGQILLGFVLFAFNIDGAVVSSVFVSNAKADAFKNDRDQRGVNPNDNLFADRFSDGAILCDLDGQEETLGSRPTRCRLNRGRLTLRGGRSSQSRSQSVPTSIDRLAFERSQGFGVLIPRFLSSRSLTRPLFLVLLKMRN